MKECNVCKKFKCKVPNLYRRGKTSLKPEDMAKTCTDAFVPKPWTNKLIFVAMKNNAQGVHAALKLAKLQLQELDRKPYFRLVLEK